MASGAEYIRKVKEQIQEVDPKEVRPLVESPNGVVIVDVREQHEFEEAHLPGAKHVPRSYLEQRIEGAAKDRSGTSRALLRLRAAAPRLPRTRSSRSSATRTSSR